MKKLIHNILAVMLVVVMVMMSFGNQSVLPISIVNANESEIVYPFGYKSSDLFVADAILGQANGLDFTNISSMPILHNYTYKTLAEGIIDNKWLLGGSVVWKNAEACLNHDFIGLVTWRQIMYETLIMDWLTYQFESDEFKSEISKSSASYGWAISNYLIKDDVKIPSKGDANTIKVFDKEFYKSIGMLEKADQINEIISGINDVYTNSKDFYKQVSNILATQSACESRISFLREVQDVTNNQSLSNAIDTVIDKLYMSAGRLSFTEGSFVMAKQLANVTWDLLIAPFETSIPLLRELKLGKAGIDWMFNTSNENSKKIELTFIYMMNADFTKAYQILRENYKDDKSEKNALVYNNAYLDYTVYQAYSSMITEEYIAEKMLNGALNEIVNIFSDYNIQSYNDLKKMLDDDIKVSQGYYNLVGKYYSTYETVFKKNEYMSWYYDNVVHPTGVYFKRKEVEIGLQDDTFYFYDDVTVTPDNVTDGSVKYTSSDESVVTVKDKQVLSIEVHKVGSAIITVTTNDGNYQDTLKINVVEGHGKDGFYLENNNEDPNIGDIFSIGELRYKIIKKGEVCVKKAADDVTDVDIPKYVSYKGYSYKVTSIGQSAFERCYILASITIPNSVTSIGWGAFFNCPSLTSITIPNSVTSIEREAFYNCTSLTSITIPNSVTSIGMSTFGYCTSLTNITIPNSVTSIEYEAFEYCTSLTNITIPNGVTSIGYYAFQFCQSLTNITIPDSVTDIRREAFLYCTNLKDITIPGNVTSIGYNAFSNCNSLVANVYNNSTGLTYCKDNNIDYKIVGTYDEFSDIQIENGTCTNIDESTELKVNQLKEGNDYDVVSKSFDNFELYDLSFYKDDQKVTIDGTAIVRIPVKEGMDGSKCKVYYNDNGTFTDMGAVYKDGYMEFETNHFSQYVVAETESSTFTLGDVNEDDKVDFLDAIVVLRHDAEIIQLTDNQMKAAEVNKDGKVDFLDAIMILRYDAEIINGFN